MQTTWVHLHGSGPDHPREEGGFKLFLSESIANASPSESAVENGTVRRSRKEKLRKALLFFMSLERWKTEEEEEEETESSRERKKVEGLKL